MWGGGVCSVGRRCLKCERGVCSVMRCLLCEGGVCCEGRCL